MSLSSFLSFLSSLGFFLFGMKLLSDSLKESAETRATTLLSKATDKPLTSVFLGAGVTGIIQSSTATTLMTLGFVESGLMGIYQAIPVIMGANIGTTVTAQIIRLADIDASNFLLSVLKPSSLSPFFILIGAVQKMFSKKREALQSASLFLGAGILFYGIEQMEISLRPLGNSEYFHNTLLRFDNPFILFISGIVLTAVLQSSSVSVGILQTVSTTGLLSFSSAIPIILGMNVGKCLPEFIASLSMSKQTKTVMLSDLIVSVSGCIIVGLFFFLLPDSTSDITATRTLIANFHTAFNIFSTFTMLPFYRQIVHLSGKITRLTEPR